MITDNDQQAAGPCALEVSVADAMTVREAFKYKHKRKGETVVEGFTGDDFHRKSGRWMHKVQMVDRESNRYFKEVVDPVSNEIVRRCEERLTEHRGHGDAKTRRPGK